MKALASFAFVGLSFAAAGLAAACQRGEPAADAVPEFIGICGLRIGLGEDTSVAHASRLLKAQRARFCRWETDGRTMLAYVATLADKCPPLEAFESASVSRAQFGTSQEFDTACFMAGIQISDMSSFTLKDILPEFPKRCFSWKLDEARNMPVTLSVQALGTVLYRDHSLPVFASYVQHDRMTLWMNHKAIRYQSDGSDAQISNAALPYGYVIERVDCPGDPGTSPV